MSEFKETGQLFKNFNTGTGSGATADNMAPENSKRRESDCKRFRLSTENASW